MDFVALEAQEKRGVKATPDEVVAKVTLWVRVAHWFHERMLAKMLRNTHKSGWQADSIDYLLYRLKGELKELTDELEGTPTAAGVIDECADIANFALMIADRAREIYNVSNSENALSNNGTSEERSE